MLKSRIAPAPRPTGNYSAGRKITLAPLACPHCAHEVRAADAELHDDGVNGWLRTGDAGYMDEEGFMVDRVKDMMSPAARTSTRPRSKRAGAASGSVGVRGDRHPERQVGRGSARHRAPARRAIGHCKRTDRPRRRADRDLQASALIRLPQRAVAVDAGAPCRARG
jgi:hypothetical protein